MMVLNSVRRLNASTPCFKIKMWLLFYYYLGGVWIRLIYLIDI